MIKNSDNKTAYDLCKNKHDDNSKACARLLKDVMERDVSIYL